jgi:hypothetical protein
MTIPDNPEALLRRNQTAIALSQAGYPTSEKTLATQASRGDGPPYHLYGRYPLYRWADVLAWARSRLRPARRSTAEHEVLAKASASADAAATVAMPPDAASEGIGILCFEAAELAKQTTQFLTSDPQTAGALPPIGQLQAPGGSNMAAKKARK